MISFILVSTCRWICIYLVCSTVSYQYAFLIHTPQILISFCGLMSVLCFCLQHLYLSQAMKKCVLCHMRTTKVQISLRIRGLISAFVVRYLDSVMSLVSLTRISSLILASVAEQASLSLTWSETPEDTFCHGAAHLFTFSA